MTQERRRADEHEVCREENDLFVYRFPCGDVTGAHMDELLTLESKAWREGLSRVHVLVVLGKDLSILPGVLPRTAQLVRSSPPRTTAFVLNKFLLRVSMEFLTRSARGLGVKTQTRIFEDEAEARAWLTRRREGRVSLPATSPEVVEGASPS